jgi:hypothetical protein
LTDVEKMSNAAPNESMKDWPVLIDSNENVCG